MMHCHAVNLTCILFESSLAAVSFPCVSDYSSFPLLPPPTVALCVMHLLVMCVVCAGTVGRARHGVLGGALSSSMTTMISTNRIHATSPPPPPPPPSTVSSRNSRSSALGATAGPNKSLVVWFVCLLECCKERGKLPLFCVT